MTRDQITKLREIFQSTGARFGIDVAIEAVADEAIEMFKREFPPTVDERTMEAVRAVIGIAAKRHGVPLKKLMRRRQPGTMQVSACRREAMARIAALGFGPTAIGRFLLRDHSTCVHGLRQFTEEEPELAAKLFGRDEIAERRAVAA